MALLVLQGLAALGTLVLATVTFLSLRELRRQRYDVSRPHLRLTVSADATVLARNDGTGWAYQIDIKCRPLGDDSKQGGNWQRATISALGPNCEVNVGYYPEHGRALTDLGAGSAAGYCRDSVGRWYRFVDRGLWPDPLGGSGLESGELEYPPVWAGPPRGFRALRRRTWFWLPESLRTHLPSRARSMLADPQQEPLLPRVRRRG